MGAGCGRAGNGRGAAVTACGEASIKATVSGTAAISVGGVRRDRTTIATACRTTMPSAMRGEKPGCRDSSAIRGKAEEESVVVGMCQKTS